MQRKTFVVDTSALMAFIEKEEGAERVKDILAHNAVILPWIAIAEVVYISWRELGEQEAMTRYALLKRLKATVIWEVDETLLLTAARFKGTKRISLADSVIAAIASLHHAILLHKDPEYEALQDQVEMEALPYKAQ